MPAATFLNLVNQLPRVIQGGMGAAVSSWTLARAVSTAGQLGVVSGVGLDLLLARRLQSGDPGGHFRRALDAFPVPEVSRRIVRDHFAPRHSGPFRAIPMHTADDPPAVLEMTAAATFAEVWLAKEGHDGLVGINFLEKMQLPVLPALYGAMLAGVDFVLMGAGIPREIPGVLDRFADNREASIALHVEGAGPDEFRLRFDPATLGTPAPTRPRFLAIVASNVLATTMARKANGRVDGFVIEGPTAGGHNAPPRGPLTLNERGEPVYGPRDEVDLDAIRALGLPFWLAGGRATRDGLREALERGAAGVQIGTAFAFCRESGLEEGIKHSLLLKARRGEASVFTDPHASPTGFPFKVAQLEGSLSEREVFEARARVCDLGYLRHPYKKADGTLGYRCPAEPVDAYVRKGGVREDAEGRKCLCNGLTANIGLPQRREGGAVELPLVTSGDDLAQLGRFLKEGEDSYSALDVLAAILEPAIA
jgi:nitronate monooxygenase